MKYQFSAASVWWGLLAWAVLVVPSHAELTVTRLDATASARANVLPSGDTDEKFFQQDLLQAPAFSGGLAVEDADEEGVFSAKARSSGSYSVVREITGSKLVINASHSSSQATTTTGETTTGNVVAGVSVQVFFTISRPAKATAIVHLSSTSSDTTFKFTDASAEFRDSGVFFDDPGSACGVCTFDNEATVSLEPGEYSTEFGMDVVCGSEARRPPPQSISAGMSIKLVIEEDAAPECDLTWSNGAGGSFATASNWDPQQQPKDDQSGCNNLLFDLAQTYAVQYDAAAANSVRVAGGDVTLQGNSLALGGNPAPGGGIRNGVEVDSPGALTFSLGAVTTKDTVVGLRPLTTGAAPAKLTLGTDAKLTSDSLTLGNDPGSSGTLIGLAPQDGQKSVLIELTSLLTVGGLGTGSVQLHASAIEAGPALLTVLGLGQGSTGTLSVDQSFAALGANATIGGGGTGNLFIEDSSGVSANTMTVGNEPGSVGLVQTFFDPATDLIPPALGTSEDLVIGKGGLGLLKLDDGGLLTAGAVTLGDAPGGSGELDVNGGDPSLTGAQVKVTGLLTVGNAGQGVLTCDAPVLPIQSGGLVLGVLGTGTASLTGGVYHFGPEIEVGVAGQGTLTATTNALVDADAMTVAALTGSTGTVSLDDHASLTLTSDLAVGKSGHGRLELAGGSGVAAVNVTVGGELGALGELILSGDTTGLNADGAIQLGSQGDGLLAVLNGTGGFVHCRNLTLGGSLATAGGTFNLDTGGAFTCERSTLVGAAAGPGLLRVKAQTQFQVGEFLVIDANGVALIERGAVIQAGLQIGGGVVRIQGNVAIPQSKTMPKALAEPARITGGLTMGAESHLQVEASGAMLEVDGPATLGGTLDILLTPGRTYNDGEELDLIAFGGTVTGQFNSIRFPNAPAGFAASGVSESGHLRLNIAHGGTGLAFPEPSAEGEGEGEGEGQVPVGCCNAGKDLAGVNGNGTWRFVGDLLLYLLGLGILLGSRGRL